jgi:hypothetical protein
MRGLRVSPTVSLCLVLGVCGCSGAPMGSDSSTSALDDNAAAQMPTQLPDSTMTPGAVLTTDVSVICAPGYSGDTRNVPASEKKKVAIEYGYTGPSSGVEYDHLVSLELGGSNDITNLWPQPIAEAHVKDRLEDYLHRQVCAGNMALADAQSGIASNWIQLWESVGRP